MEKTNKIKIYLADGQEQDLKAIEKDTRKIFPNTMIMQDLQEIDIPLNKESDAK